MINQNKLDKLEENLDNALEKETSESLTEWMNQKRLTQKLREHLDTITPEQFEEEINEIQKEGFGGPTMEEFICEMDDCPHCAYDRQQDYEAELEKEAAIDFAKWLAQSWMSIWVEDKWLWENVEEDMPQEYIGYKTEEELYTLYLKAN